MNHPFAVAAHPDALAALAIAEGVIRALPEGEYSVAEVASVVAMFVPHATVVGGVCNGRLHAWLRIPNGPFTCWLNPMTFSRYPPVQLVSPADRAYTAERDGSWSPTREDVLVGMVDAVSRAGMTRMS